MKLEHATIEIVEPAGAVEPIEVLFNPKDYKLARSNQFSEIAVPGLESPPLQFGRGNARTLSMQLFFDTYTYKNGEDVQTYVDRILNLLAINAELHAPPICKFSWGKKLQFVGVLERADSNYTLFLPDGTPVRATVDVTFKEYINDSADRQSANFVKQYVVQRGDTLSSIAHQKYGDPGLWRAIADANDVVDPLMLVPGRLLVVPAIE